MCRIEGTGNTDSYEKKYSALSLERPHLFEAPPLYTEGELHKHSACKICDNLCTFVGLIISHEGHG